MRYEVRDEGAEKALKGIGESIGKNLPKNMGFTLFIYDYGDGGNMFYMSSAKREDMLKAMKEFISKQEGEAHVCNFIPCDEWPATCLCGKQENEN